MCPENPAEVRQVLESGLIRHFTHRLVGVAHQLACQRKPLPEEPFSGSCAVHLLKIALERRKAAAAELRIFLKGEVETKIGLHDMPKCRGLRPFEQGAEIGL